METRIEQFMNLSISVPNKNDIDALYKAFLNCGQYTRSMYFPHGYTIDNARKICSNPSNSEIKYYIIKISNEIVSFGFININRKSFGFAVIDKYQNKGIGNRFTDFILSYAKMNGFKSIKTDGGTYVESHMKDILIKKGFKITNKFILKNKPAIMIEKVIQ